MYTLTVILFIVVCLFLILVVLLQQGKGADVAAAFGGSSSQASFGFTRPGDWTTSSISSGNRHSLLFILYHLNK